MAMNSPPAAKSTKEKQSEVIDTPVGPVVVSWYGDRAESAGRMVRSIVKTFGLTSVPHTPRIPRVLHVSKPLESEAVREGGVT